MSEKSKSQKTSFSNFKNIQVIGQGAFGIVYKGYYERNNKAFAIKKISKKQLVAQSMIQQMQNQIKIMYSLDHPNIIKIYQVIDQDDHLYLVLQLAEHGQLYKRLTQKTRFDQQTTKIMIRDTIAALQYLHSRNPPIIHRDIKPENILLDKNDRIKLADFGWSNFNNKQKRTTYCGTFDYLAPQMIDKSGHDQKLDIWCLGVLVYQLLTGKPPFSPNPNQVPSGQEIKKLQENILNVKINFPSDFPVLAKDFVLGILRRNPKQRYTLKQLKNHQWLIKKQQPIMSINPNSPKKQQITVNEQDNVIERYKLRIQQMSRKIKQLQKQLQKTRVNESLLIKQNSKKQQNSIQINSGIDQKRLNAIQQMNEKYKRQIQKYHNEVKQKQKQIMKMRNEIKNLQKVKNDYERIQSEKSKYEQKYKKSKLEYQELQNKYIELNKKLLNQKYQYESRIKQQKYNNKNNGGSFKSIDSPDFIEELQKGISQLTKKFNQSKKILSQIAKKQGNNQQMQKQLQKLKFQHQTIRQQVKIQLKQYYQQKMDEIILKTRQQLNIEREKWLKQRQQLLNLNKQSDNNNDKSTSSSSLNLKQKQLQLQLKSTRDLNIYLQKRNKQQQYKIKDLQDIIKKKNK